MNKNLELKGWFDCLNGLAIELNGTYKYDSEKLLINVMVSAGITTEELQWAKKQNYTSIQDVLILYEKELAK